jgi:ribonuclease VapC
MVIDTSAIAAILFDEPDAGALEGKIADDPVRLMSAATFLEATIVIEARLGDPGGREFDLWLHRAEVEIFPVDAEQADMARRAWRRYGRGRHPAAHPGQCPSDRQASSSAI